MPQGDKNKKILYAKMAVKVTKGQICNGTISEIRYHKEYYLCGKFHNCFTKGTKCLIFGAMPLY